MTCTHSKANEPSTTQGSRCSVPKMLLAHSCNGAWLLNKSLRALSAAFCTSAIAGGRWCWDTSLVMAWRVGEPSESHARFSGRTAAMPFCIAQLLGGVVVLHPPSVQPWGPPGENIAPVLLDERWKHL
jgi:hypothetical protein